MTSIDLATLLESLPACKRCRKNRRRCDTLLPSCANCSKAGVECIFFDHALQEELPRSYIASLVEHLEGGESISPDLRMYLTQLFFGTVHQVYPILDPGSPWLSDDASPTHAFIQEMVCAVACHCAPQGDPPSLQRLAPAAHARALRHIEQATAAQAVSTLQVVVLLVLYTLVCPATGGNLSQQLGFAIRLVIDLCEGGDADGGDGGQPEGCSPPLSSLYRVIYCLENHVCGVLVRPTALPEPAEALAMPSFSSFVSSPACSESRSLGLLCTLYRVQARCRQGRLEGQDNAVLRTFVLAFAEAYRHQERQERQQESEEKALLNPNVAAVLGETCLVLEPASVDAAMALLEAYSDAAFLATFASAYWVHRAGNVVVDHLLVGGGTVHGPLLRAYGQATALLQAWAGTWDAARVLRQALEQRLEGDPWH
ncbi:hypothetical protein SCUCBS95973_007845 [Sporothrix curviconia]|uniref:Zn(2)-C6 fungal-type domain-containing protein n=1 Tax=Sporothrix curviconia TaxID=1260050 RepID=A0ABP0CHF4_9PEZI